MKIVRRGALPVGGESGLLDVRDRALAGRPVAGAVRGTCPDARHLARVRRARAVLRRRRPRSGRCGRDRRRERDGRRDAAARARAAADRGGPLLLRARRDASRTTSRTRCCPRTASSSSRKTLEEGADLGVAFDGDADRCFFVDDTGEFVPGDFVTALLARGGAREGARREGHLRRARELGRARDDRARRRHGRSSTASATPSSSTGCARRTPPSAARSPGHYYFRDFSQADSGVVPFLLMLELISKSGPKLSEILRPFRERYFITGELNTPVADVRAQAAELKERFGPEGTRLAPRRRLGRRRTTGTSTCGRRTPSRCSA